ncbi:MAG: nucleotidyl transferase AbiEii/AbiGii toxin family protein [Actinomycetota bacterium]
MTVSHRERGGATYLRLQTLARKNGRPTQELLQLFVLEAFLDRLSRSTYRQSLIVKGGVLLASYGHRRPTRDIDLHARSMHNDEDHVRGIVCSIAEVDVDDGVSFEPSLARSSVIRGDEWYSGVRVTMAARIATASIDFHVDISVGDPIFPEPVPRDIPRILDGVITLRTYPLEMICAEKIVTALARGTTNTRLRDFSDVVALTETNSLRGDQLSTAVRAVAMHRNVSFQPLSDLLVGLAERRQSDWLAWRRRQPDDGQHPERFADVVEGFITFADPVIEGSVATLTWNPGSRAWT